MAKVTKYTGCPLGTMAEKQLNILFFGGFPYPQGMAGTKRVQHAIDGLKVFPGTLIRVLIMRQSSRENVLNGCHEGIPYETVTDVSGKTGLMLSLASLNYRLARLFGRYYRAECLNIIYSYGPLRLENAIALYCARCLGYKVVLDIVEDYDLAMDISRSPFHQGKMLGMKALGQFVENVASGLIVISSHLEEKFRGLSGGRLPIHYRPISVDFSRFAAFPRPWEGAVSLFYSGSFGQKDGVPLLLDAFDRVAARRADVRLVLTGKGSGEMMRPILARIEASPFKERIEYKGYLDDAAYYAALNASDIPCMTRVDSAFANAGFPFKLGEFLATGKPVIASRVSDVASALKDGREVALVNPGDSDSIAHAVEHLIDNPQRARAIGAAGREVARRLYDFHEQGRALRTFLTSL